MQLLKKASNILTRKYVNKVFILLIFMVISVFLETLGIALVFPVLSFLADGNFISKFDVINNFVDFIQSNFKAKNISTIAIGILLFSYFIKNIFLFFFTWWKVSLIDKLYRDLCERLLMNYMYLPYLSYVGKNTAILARNFVEIKGFLKFIDNLIIFIVETLILIAISFLLLTIEPLATIIVATVISLIAFFFRSFSKKYIDLWGKKRLEHSGSSLKSLLQALNSFKVVKILGREKNFISDYKNFNFRYSTVKKYFDILDNTPKYWLEFLGVFGLCFLTFILIEKDDKVMNIIPTLGLFSASAFRLLPSITRILRAYQALNFSVPVVNTLDNELKILSINDEIENSNQISFKNKVEVKNLYFKYPGKKDYILQDLSFNINKGEVIGVMGTTGSGKSTFIDILTGLIEPEKGKILSDNINIKENLKSWQKLIGYVPQSVQMIDDTIRSNIIFGLEKNNFKESDIDEIIKVVQLQEFIDSLDDGLETIVGDKGVKLSGGQQQRIGIARALFHRPSFIIFDEATSALDSETEKRLMGEIKIFTKERSLLIISHRRTTLEYCNKIYLFKDSQLHLEN
jgi:ATP-binding cassette, subfamily B, bacterial PglK